MSLFNKYFGDSNPKVTTENDVGWNTLTELKQLDEIVSQSFVKPVIIFKHSTRCGISRMALRGFETDYSIPADCATPYFLDLLRYREVSDEVARRFTVVHQSPQVLVIRNSASIFDASHGDIDALSLKDKIQQLRVE